MTGWRSAAGAPRTTSARRSGRPSTAFPAVFAALRRTLAELFPVVRTARITHAWGGPIGVPRDWCASVGLDRSTGLGWAGGYVGDGVSTTNLAGRTLADLITGDRLRPHPTALGRPSFAALGARAAALAGRERRPDGDELGRPAGGQDRPPVPPGRPRRPLSRPIACQAMIRTSLSLPAKLAGSCAASSIGRAADS